MITTKIGERAEEEDVGPLQANPRANAAPHKGAAQQGHTSAHGPHMCGAGGRYLILFGGLQQAARSATTGSDGTVLQGSVARGLPVRRDGSHGELAVPVLDVGVLLDGVPVAAEHPLGGEEALHADGAAGVDAGGGDADLGTQAEAEAVGEAGAGVVEDAGRVHPPQEVLRHLPVLCRRIAGRFI